jgi:hypothetical protein|tara:strand:+ start:218 stop:631 length:414 start_codon:yes stop_codon:yes gene_type:complete
MNKKDLKKLIKPLVKECIHEVLLEEGLLSNVVSEVAKGMQGTVITENQSPQERFSLRETQDIEQSRSKMRANRRKLMESIGSDAYNGVDLFEGTQPLTKREVATPAAGAVDLGSPSDSGVDISSLMGDASKIWQAMK